MHSLCQVHISSIQWLQKDRLTIEKRKTQGISPTGKGLYSIRHCYKATMDKLKNYSPTRPPHQDNAPTSGDAPQHRTNTVRAASTALPNSPAFHWQRLSATTEALVRSRKIYVTGRYLYTGKIGY